MSEDGGDDAAFEQQHGMKPDAVPDAGAMDFASLRAQNDEIVAWVTIDGTKIDYPVVQTTDNKYYLTHTAEKKSASQGAVFMDFRNNRELSDFYTILYGHNLRSGRMFGELVRFKEKDFFDSHRTGTLHTPNKTYKLEIIACSVTKDTSEYYRYAFASPAEREAHLTMIRNTATHMASAKIDPQTDRLVALSTCSYEYGNARTVVVTKIAE
jgi:sortase B